MYKLFFDVTLSALNLDEPLDYKANMCRGHWPLVPLLVPSQYWWEIHTLKTNPLHQVVVWLLIHSTPNTTLADQFPSWVEQGASLIPTKQHTYPSQHLLQRYTNISTLAPCSDCLSVIFIYLRLCQATAGHTVASSEVFKTFVVDEFHQRFVAELILGLETHKIRQ